LLLIYRELNILCVKYSLYSPYDDDVIIQDGVSWHCPLPYTAHKSAYSTTASSLSINRKSWMPDWMV